MRVVDTPAAISHDVIGHINIENQFTWSQTNVDAVKSWIRRCSTDHPSCKTTVSVCESINAEEAPLPTRCLEIWPVSPSNGNSQGLGCVLRETKGLFGRYIALSHRWEKGTRSVRTLKDNYSFQTSKCDGSHVFDGIKLTENFKRACNLAVRFGVRFIWIDSLCIVQDDLEDWNRESTQMGNYYQCAWLTIFVAMPSLTEPSAAQPTFAEPSTSPANTETIPRIQRLPYRDKNKQQQGYFYLHCTGAAAVTEDYMQGIIESDLLMRGWVCQEWFLSRRRLALSPTGAYLQCSEGPPQTTSGEIVRIPKDFGTNVMASLDMKSHESILASWRALVEHYSRLSFSYITKDRLSALTGLANEFSIALYNSQSDLAYHFVSGLWFGRLMPPTKKIFGNADLNHFFTRLWYPDVTSLLWLQGGPGPTYRIKGIPTWSWASTATFKEGETEAGMPVVWGWHDNQPFRSNMHLSLRWNDRRTVCAFTDIVAVPVDKDCWEPMFGSEPDNKHANGHRFSMLGIRGRLMPVTIHGEFQSPDDILLAASITMHAENTGTSMWRRATLPTRPDVIRGWASLEHPNFQRGVEGTSVHTLLALIVQATVARGGLALGNWMRNTCPAYRVLFVGEVGIPNHRNTYERIGAGVVFGYEFKEEFDRAEWKTFWLV